MKPSPYKFTALALLVFGAVGLQAQDAHRIEFQNPENFADVKRSMFPSDWERQHILEDLEAYMRRAIERKFGDAYHVAITVTEVDMAGDFEPWRSPSASEVRVVRDAYPARLSFSYRITDRDGKVVQEGAEKLRNMSMSFWPVSLTMQGETAPYVKELFNRWVRSVRL